VCVSICTCNELVCEREVERQREICDMMYAYERVLHVFVCVCVCERERRAYV
jgi:hypothetical protein